MYLYVCFNKNHCFLSEWALRTPLCSVWFIHTWNSQEAWISPDHNDKAYADSNPDHIGSVTYI